MPRHSIIPPALIEAVRTYAAAGLSFQGAADHLNLTRHQVAGMARRYGIKFSGKPGPIYPMLRKKKKRAPLRTVLAALLPFIQVDRHGERRTVSYRFYGRGIWRRRERRGWTSISGDLVPGSVFKAAAELVNQ